MLNYSIIIPHYNIPDLLLRCLGSIPLRDDTEVIIVDDNSPDAESYLDRYPALGRPDVILFRNSERKGAGAARNIGLSYSTGKWILFADADDFFVEDFNDILDQYLSCSEDLLFFRKRSVFSNNPEKRSGKNSWIEALFDEYYKTGDEKSLRCLHYVPWGKFIKREVIVDNDIQFDEIPYSNDVIFSVKVGLAAKRIAVFDRIVYIYTEREGSLSGSFCRKPGELELRCNVLFRAQRLFADKGIHIIQPQIPSMLGKMLRYDRNLFWHFFYRLPEVQLSRWEISRQLMRLISRWLFIKFKMIVDPGTTMVDQQVYSEGW